MKLDGRAGCLRTGVDRATPQDGLTVLKYYGDADYTSNGLILWSNSSRPREVMQPSPII
jgi:hypothetical protein